MSLTADCERLRRRCLLLLIFIQDFEDNGQTAPFPRRKVGREQVSVIFRSSEVSGVTYRKSAHISIPMRSLAASEPTYRASSLAVAVEPTGALICV